MRKLGLQFLLSMSYALTLLMVPFLVSAAKPKPSTYVKIATSQGDIFARLYDETPKHRDNFIKIINDKTLENTLFHRVIKDFMIQGGDPDSKTAKKGQMLGSGGLDYRVDAEFVDSLFHKKGALSAARDNNPEKASSPCQFYIVQGKKITDKELDDLEKYRMKGKKFSAKQREIYKTIGGTPFLDQNYTVFGEVVKGLEVVDQISLEKTDRNDRPENDVRMQVSVLKKKEVKKLLKSLK